MHPASIQSFGAQPSPFGHPQYTGNIIQGGVALQPQAYQFGGVTYLDAIVVTGDASVAPDPVTGASVAMGRFLFVVGSSASLHPSTNSKGLVLLFSGGIFVSAGGAIHIDKLGKAGNFGNLTVLDLVPAALAGRISKPLLSSFVVNGEGAAGAPGSGDSSDMTYKGAVAGQMQTGGGGRGGCNGGSVPSGGKGGPCCGGAGSGGAFSSSGGAPGDYGGPGGKGSSTLINYVEGTGGCGDPPGASSNQPPTPIYGAGGGLLMLFSPRVQVDAGSRISSDGANSQQSLTTRTLNGGPAGGGCIVIGTLPGGLLNNGTIRANGGAGLSGHVYMTSSNAGPGSVNLFTITH